MKFNRLFSLVAVPAIALGYVVYHPGVAFAKTPLSRLLSPTAFQSDTSFTVDPAHTCVGFDIGHLGLSRVQGRFDKLSGSISVKPKELAKSSVKVVIQTDSVDTNVGPRDADLKSANFFEVATYPEMTFESTSIKRKGSGYIAEGKLTLKGVTKSVSIPFKQYGPIKDPWGNNRIGILADPITIHRSDYGMNFDADTVSNDVVVHISLEATEDKTAK